MTTGSPLFKGLGLASGMGAPETGGGSDPLSPFSETYAFKPKQAPLSAKQIAKLKIIDTRKINPANGQPFKKPGAMSASVNPNVVSAIIRQAVSKGVDPNTALAIAMQETHMGNKNENVGSAWSTFSDEGIDDPYEQGANSMVKALVDKLAYAKRLGYDKKGEAFALQAYNGYGKLKPQQTTGNPTEYFYEMPVTRSNPLNMAQNPVYGKTIMSLRDEVISKNPELQALIQKELAARQAQQKQQQPMQAPVLAYAQQ